MISGGERELKQEVKEEDVEERGEIHVDAKCFGEQKTQVPDDKCTRI